MLGIDKTIDANVLQNNAIDIVTHAIIVNRDNFLKAISANQAETIEKYTVQDAVTDAIRYNNLCSLTQAVASIKKAVDQKAANEEALKQVRLQFSEQELQDAEKQIVDATAAQKSSDIIQIYKDRRDRAKLAYEALVKASGGGAAPASGVAPAP